MKQEEQFAYALMKFYKNNANSFQNEKIDKILKVSVAKTFDIDGIKFYLRVVDNRATLSFSRGDKTGAATFEVDVNNFDDLSEWKAISANYSSDLYNTNYSNCDNVYFDLVKQESFFRSTKIVYHNSQKNGNFSKNKYINEEILSKSEERIILLSAYSFMNEMGKKMEEYSQENNKLKI